MIPSWYASLNIQKKIVAPTIGLLTTAIASIILLSVGSVWVISQKQALGDFTHESSAKLSDLEETIVTIQGVER